MDLKRFTESVTCQKAHPLKSCIRAFASSISNGNTDQVRCIT